MPLHVLVAYVNKYHQNFAYQALTMEQITAIFISNTQAVELIIYLNPIYQPFCPLRFCNVCLTYYNVCLTYYNVCSTYHIN